MYFISLTQNHIERRVYSVFYFSNSLHQNEIKAYEKKCDQSASDYDKINTSYKDLKVQVSSFVDKTFLKTH